MKTNKLLLGTMISMIFLSGCAAQVQPEIKTAKPQEVIKEVGLITLENPDIDMYKNFVDKDQNWMYSPYSMKDAFSLLYHGANDDVKSEFKSILGLDEQSVNFIKKYDTALQKSDSINVANRVYVTNDEKNRENLNLKVLKLPEKSVEEMDVSNPKQAAGKINQFVSDMTNEKIKDFVSEHSIHEDTSLFLVNALYFNKKWKFDSGSIVWSDGNHYKSFHDSSYPVTLVKEVDDGNIDVLRLNYDKENYNENRYAMTVFCKSESADENKVDAYIENLSKKEFDEVMNFENYEGLDGYTQAEFHVPNFEFENKESFSEGLKRIGMTKTFTSDAFNKLGQVSVSDVFQATYIKTDEYGTEAAAATGIVMEMSAQIEIGAVKRVRADDTFVFVISDTTTGNILFMGRVVQPTELQS